MIYRKKCKKDEEDDQLEQEQPDDKVKDTVGIKEDDGKIKIFEPAVLDKEEISESSSSAAEAPPTRMEFYSNQHLQIHKRD